MGSKTIDFLFDQGKTLLNLAEKQNVDEVQLSLVKSLEIGTRFGENHITQNTYTDTTNTLIILVKDKKIGKISLHLPEPEQYKNVIDDAVTIMKFSEPDTDFPGFIQKSKSNPRFQHIDDHYKVETVADGVKNIINSAHSYDSSIKTVAGNINTFNDYQVFLNSYGVELWEYSSRVSSVINVSAMAQGQEYESRSTIKLSGKTINKLKLEENVKVCAERAKRGLHQTALDVGSYESVLSPSSISALSQFIGSATSAESLVTHTSFLTDKLGEQVFDKSLTITDERNNPEHFFSSSFDSEGTPVESVTFIENGILKDFAYNRRLSKKLIDGKSNGRNSTGFMGEMPVFASQTISPGSKSEEELIKSVDNGIYIVNLFYNNFVNPPEGLCTGLTRDGLFKIEHGEIVGSLKNMRWTDKIESIFKKVMIGNNSIQIGGFFFGSTVTPSIKTEKFTFTSAGKH